MLAMRDYLLPLIWMIAFSHPVWANWQRAGGESVSELGEIHGAATYTRTFPVEPGQDYLFSAVVEGDCPVNFLIRAPEISAPYWKKIAYNRIGEQQKVLGLYNSRNASGLTVEVRTVPSSYANPGLTKLQEVRLEKVDFSKTPLQRKKTFSATTRIDAETLIVIPAEDTEAQDHRRLAELIQAKFSGRPRIVRDQEVCLEDAPAIRPEFAARHLIILGNLDSNRAIWPAYVRSLAASDNYYPGAAGYEVRTAVNVLDQGGNHIIIGSTRLQGLEAGVQRFLELAVEELPYLLEIRLDGACRNRVEADIKLWKGFPDGPFPQEEPGYHTIRRWYHNAMLYYWTGDAFYKTMARELFQPVLKDMAYTHHYIMEWLILTWRMVAMTDLYSDAEKAQAELLIFQNYLEFQKGADLYWMQFMTPPYDQVMQASRHNTSPWMCQLELSNYLRNNLELDGPLLELVDFTFEEMSRALYGIAMSRQEQDGGGGDGQGLEEQILSFYRFALRYDRHDFFQSGMARNWAHIEFLDQSNVRNSVLFRSRFNFHLIVSILSSYYRDAQLKYYYNTSDYDIFQQGMFADRYTCGIGYFHNGISAVMPEDYNRLLLRKVSDLERNRNRFWQQTVSKDPRNAGRDAVAMLILTGGSQKQRPVLAVSGYDKYLARAGEITQFSAGGIAWLHNYWTGLYNRDTGLPFECNMLYVNHAGQGVDALQDHAPMSVLDWKLDLKKVQAASLRITPYNGVEWKRQLYQLDPESYLVHDAVIALQEGDYDIGVTWRPVATPQMNTENTLLAKHGEHTFSITCAGERFRLESNTRNYLDKLAPKLNSRFAFHGPLKQGEKLAAGALLQMDSQRALHHAGGSRFLISEQGKVISEIHFFADGVIEISRQRLVCCNQPELEIGGIVVASLPDQANFLWDFNSATTFSNGDVQHKVSDSENQRVQNICCAYLDGLNIPAQTTAALPEAGAGEESSTTSAYEKLWSWNKFAAPVPVFFGYAGRQEYDLGETMQLSSVRSIFVQQELPAFMEVSEDRVAWRKVPLEGRWYSGPLCRNYGETHPQEKWFQQADLLEPVQTRYVRFAKEECIQFYRNDQLAPWRPVKILNTQPNLLLANEVIKAWPRRYQSEDNRIAILKHDGEEKFLYESKKALHEVKFLNYPAKDSLGLVTAEGQLEFYDQQGKPLLHIDVYQSLKDFHAQHGRPGIRHPAGGFAATYSLGAWRNPVQLVAPRYGQVNFFAENGSLIGMLHAAIYSQPYTLDQGVDFNGDGIEEQISLSCQYLVHLDGSDTPSVRAPGSNTFWPEVYSFNRIGFPVSWNDTFGTWGAKVFCFKQLDMGADKYILAYTRTFMLVYDGRNKKYVYTWKALAPVAGADVAALGADHWRAAVCGDDNTITVTDWQKDAAQPVTVLRTSWQDECNAIHVTAQGEVFIAGKQGLYEVSGQQVIRRLPGNFTDVKSLERDLITADSKGEVCRWKR
ncbi:MAG: hypothetical protein GX946_12100 [Oligosphaeraceae bacterium]|nr:hypothetical protein [Oligosphaeraceae bacterium]